MSESKETGLQTEVKSLQERVAAMGTKIVNSQQYEAWCGVMVLAKRQIEMIAAHYKPQKEAAHHAHKVVCDAESRDLKIPKEIDALGRKVTGEWATAERDRKAREQAEAVAAARKAEEARIEAEAKALREAGAHEEAAFLEAEPPPAPVALAAPPVETVAGVGMDTVYEWVEVDHDAVPPKYTIANKPMLDGVAKATKSTAVVAGIQFTSRLRPRNRG